MNKLSYMDADQPVTVEVYGDQSTLLEISQKNRIPHFQECGGRGKCTTCRVEIISGMHNLSPRNETEHDLADSRGWGEAIRLACQSKLSGDVTLRRFLPKVDFVSIPQATEQSVVVLVCDIRSFTPHTEKQLPFDIVHILNDYYEEICEPLLARGGYIDKYMGDGLLALFGINHKNQAFLHEAVSCALEMTDRANDMAHRFKKEYNFDLKIGLALHYGTVIMGEVGHHSKRQLTFIGDAVNLASKLEKLNKQFGTTILITDQLYQLVTDSVVVQQSFLTKLDGIEEAQLLHELVSLAR